MVWKVFRRPLVVTTLAFGLSSSINGSEQLGAKPAALESIYKTERDWAIGETFTDVVEMVEKATGRKHSVAAMTESIATPWDPDLIAPIPRRWLEEPEVAPRKQVDAAPVHPRLTHLTAPALIDASAHISFALNVDMRNARSHEAAALVVGAFALREAAGGLSDVRWSLNRMTAHLAMAAALQDGSPSVDGILARVVLLALTNRQVKALAALSALDGAPSDALKA